MLIQDVIVAAIFGLLMMVHRVRSNIIPVQYEDSFDNNTEISSNDGPDFLPFNPCSGRYGPFCLDCKTHITCADVLINLQTCSSIDAKKPYCRNNACSSEPIKNCKVDSFRCTSIGQFPHPTDCTQYYFCPDLSSQGAISMSCPYNYVYDSPTGWCKQQRATSDCKTISSSGKVNNYQVLPHDPSILAYCADTPNFKETILFRCPDYQNMEYDPNTLKCNFVCRNEGRYSDKADCTKYYECFKNGNSLDYTKIQCPNGFKYDDTKKMCVFGMC